MNALTHTRQYTATDRPSVRCQCNAVRRMVDSVTDQTNYRSMITRNVKLRANIDLTANKRIHKH